MRASGPSTSGGTWPLRLVLAQGQLASPTQQRCDHDLVGVFRLLRVSLTVLLWHEVSSLDMRHRPLPRLRVAALDGAKQKVGRAQEHMTLLEGEITRFFKDNPDALRIDFRQEDDPQLLPMYVAHIADASESPIGLVLGDVINNFRSALDHIAWQLVAHGRKQRHLETAPDTIKFPIVTGPSKKGKSASEYFRDGLGGWLPGVSTVHKTIIRSHQPYRRRPFPLRHALALLQTLSNTDKHRRLHTVLWLPTETGFNVINLPAGCRIIGFKAGPGLGKPLRVGSELGYYTVTDKALCDGFEVQPRQHLTIAFEAGIDETPDSLPVFDVMWWIENEVLNVLDEIDAVL